MGLHVKYGPHSQPFGTRRLRRLLMFPLHRCMCVPYFGVRCHAMSRGAGPPRHPHAKILCRTAAGTTSRHPGSTAVAQWRVGSFERKGRGAHVPAQKHPHRELLCDCGLREIAVSVLPTGHFGRSVSSGHWRCIFYSVFERGCSREAPNA